MPTAPTNTDAVSRPAQARTPEVASGPTRKEIYRFQKCFRECFSSAFHLPLDCRRRCASASRTPRRNNLKPACSRCIAATMSRKDYFSATPASGLPPRRLAIARRPRARSAAQPRRCRTSADRERFRTVAAVTHRASAGVTGFGAGSVPAIVPRPARSGLAAKVLYSGGERGGRRAPAQALQPRRQRTSCLDGHRAAPARVF